MILFFFIKWKDLLSGDTWQMPFYHDQNSTDTLWRENEAYTNNEM